MQANTDTKIRSRSTRLDTSRKRPCECASCPGMSRPAPTTCRKRFRFFATAPVATVAEYTRRMCTLSLHLLKDVQTEVPGVITICSRTVNACLLACRRAPNEGYGPIFHTVRALRLCLSDVPPCRCIRSAVPPVAVALVGIACCPGAAALVQQHVCKISTLMLLLLYRHPFCLQPFHRQPLHRQPLSSQLLCSQTMCWLPFPPRPCT